MNTLTQSLSQALMLIQSGDSLLWSTVWLSLSVSGSATVFGGFLGLLLAAFLLWRPWPAHRWWIAGVHVWLAMPSVVVGLLIYLLLSRAGPLGSWGLLFTPTAMVMAQTVLVIPIVAALSRDHLAQALREGGETLQSLGAQPWQTFLLLLLHTRTSLALVFVTAFSRTVSEIGAVMIVGGNIEGVTRVMTTSIALETSKGDLPQALGLGIVLMGVILCLHGLMMVVRPVPAVDTLHTLSAGKTP